MSKFKSLFVLFAILLALPASAETAFPKFYFRVCLVHDAARDGKSLSMGCEFAKITTSEDRLYSEFIVGDRTYPLHIDSFEYSDHPGWLGNRINFTLSKVTVSDLITALNGQFRLRFMDHARWVRTLADEALGNESKTEFTLKVRPTKTESEVQLHQPGSPDMIRLTFEMIGRYDYFLGRMVDER